MDVNDTSGPQTPKILNGGTMFTTEKPGGAYCDVITIECNKINYKIFRGTITYIEAKNMFVKALGLSEELLYSTKIN